jgi:deoxyribonuclease (pyrimidine dimer)
LQKAIQCSTFVQIKIMTRISVAVRGSELCDAHLIKERIEILRIPNSIKSGKAKVNLSKIPSMFTLGTGHVVFFYPRLKYLHKRYNELTEECIKRNFNITDYSDAFDGLPEYLYKDYEEKPNDRKILVERINERLSTMKNLKLYGKPITLEQIKLK